MKLQKPKILFALIALSIAIAPFSQVKSAFADQATDQTKAQLEQELQQINAQIAQYQSQLNQIGAQKDTLNNKIHQLDIQKQYYTAQIQATNLTIGNIVQQLQTTQDQIGQDQDHLTLLQGETAALLEQLYEQQQASSIEQILGSGGFSGFFDQVNNEMRLNSKISDLSNQVADQQKQLQSDQQQLSDQKDQQNNYLQIVNLQSSQLADSISEQNQILQETKGRESVYQAMLNNSAAQAKAIEDRLYELSGTTTAVTFGQALQIAQWASSQTGVRPAFLLAILTQESNLGKNVGTCNRAGDPPSKSYKVVMNPTRDQPVFLQVTKQLNLDPDITPISCPMHDRYGNQIGWGGAMGPAQFIPSTWVGYAGAVTSITGNIANPWDIKDAFLAAALKLGSQGATSQSGEWAAAMRYFSGSTNLRYRFYGDNVVALAAKYQADIDALNQ